ncbi:flavin-containing monooxygenase [Mobilicoccus caccae]|uniref:FAD-containing monooxygenase EthA n=1 Tax=Mobilicoccus caccae TaxID=1859295 RepID=A0ABQ6ITG5_9MICO|nr:NAD(P)/FAD-dependent oxidoreductase [Mobilicoccus caccae]GMA40774.1 FAD-containing monooxygenase EthA [Mobilicoccus caccae]
MNTPIEREPDVLIVGAGLSGIDVAYRLQERCPDLTYDIVDSREAIGGTWDLFRYPGIRSDSDFFTLALPFHPWTGKDSIVEGEEILRYLAEVTHRYGIDRHLRLRTRVLSADWSSDTRRWNVRVEADGREEVYVVRFLVVCTGYYDYESPHDAGFAGIDSFDGPVIHPQFWPQDVDHRGKDVAVIGSGATSITLVPALARDGARVTMVQRTPTYVLAQPRHDVVADVLRRVLPAGAAHQVMRVKNTALQWGLYQACQRAPRAMRAVLRRGAVAGVGSEAIVDRHLTPPYDPWDQRLCIAPEGDFFTAIKDGTARIVTGTIESFVPEGVRMSDGTVVKADIVVTATGLRIKLMGGIDVSLDGRPVDVSEALVYRGAMLSGVPNLAFCVGYINLSWTMRSDLTARLVARVLRRFVDTGATQVVPVPPDDIGETGPLLDMKAGYLARAADSMPRATKRYPWTMAQNVVRDAWSTNRADLDDGLVWQVAR